MTTTRKYLTSFVFTPLNLVTLYFVHCLLNRGVLAVNTDYVDMRKHFIDQIREAEFDPLNFLRAIDMATTSNINMESVESLRTILTDPRGTGRKLLWSRAEYQRA